MQPQAAASERRSRHRLMIADLLSELICRIKPLPARHQITLHGECSGSFCKQRRQIVYQTGNHHDSLSNLPQTGATHSQRILAQQVSLSQRDN
jgi:hypothetical protein